MSARVSWDGLTELRAALRRLPRDLAAEASGIVNAAAEAAKTDIVGAYPERTGDLKNHVYVTSSPSSGNYGAAAVVKNTAKHAYIFENGTQTRHNAIGANRGSMPAGHVFIPAVIRRRREMYEQLKALLTSHGLLVTGDA